MSNGDRIATIRVAARSVKNTRTTIENDQGLIKLMERAQKEIYSGNAAAFDQAYAEALATQIVDLAEANDCHPGNLATELADAMRGVLVQWLGEYPCYAKRDIPGFLQQVVKQAQ